MIGVLGASGAVGRAAVTALREAGLGPLRLGARRPHALPADGAAERVAVDATDPRSLAAFCAGLTVLLNCAGPTYELQERMAVAALAAGSDYVDVGGDDPVAEALAARGAPPQGRSVVLSAGTLPGLSVIVPRWLAGRSPGGTRLVAYAGGLEPCTRTVAEEVLLSLTVGGAGGEAFGHSLAAWRHGRRAEKVLRITEDADVPSFPDRAVAHPLLTAESERLAAALGLAELDFYNVHPGPRVRALFAQLPTLDTTAGSARDRVIDRLTAAASVDLAGREPYYRMLFTLTGQHGSRSATVRSGDSYRLTAAVAVLAVRAVLAGEIKPGLHYGGEVLNPHWAVDEINRGGAARVEEVGELSTAYEVGAL